MNPKQVPDQPERNRELRRFIVDGVLILIAMLVAVPIAITIQAEVIAPYLFGIGT